MRIVTRTDSGGTASQAALLAEHLHPRRFESVLLSGGEPRRDGETTEMGGPGTVKTVVVTSLGGETAGGDVLSTVRQLLKLMREHRPHIVHTHTIRAGHAGRVAATLARVPVRIHTLHTSAFHDGGDPAQTRKVIRSESTLARFTERILVLSQQQKKEILALGVGRANQFHIIPPGLDLEPFLHAEEHRGDLRDELGLTAKVPLVGIVARLVPKQAIDLFLPAARQVLQTQADAVFLVVGDGELRQELEKQAATLGIGQAVRFLGFRSDLPRIYADLNCAVVISSHDGVPTSVLEAQASACPVVATDAGGIRDVVVHGNSGLVVPPEDAGALAGAICKILQDPVTALRLGEAGRHMAHPAFGVERLVADTEALYFELLQEKGLLPRVAPVLPGT